MGLYEINCPRCNGQHVWFSGNMDQRCDACRKAAMTIKDHVKGTVKFEYYRDGHMYYKTETGLRFPVPISEAGNATFLAEDKAMLFMRYIRRHLDFLKSGIPF